jgi:hypothetical protein
MHKCPDVIRLMDDDNYGDFLVLLHFHSDMEKFDWCISALKYGCQLLHLEVDGSRRHVMKGCLPLPFPAL